MRQTLWLLATIVGLSGCSAALPYKPESPPPSGASVSADYGLLPDRLRVEIDTGGYRLEDAQIAPAGGGSVRPETIEHPPAGGGSAVGFGVGGGGSFGGGGRGAVGVGSGVGITMPIGGSSRVSGNTVVYFPLSQIGPAPWRLFVKVADTNPAVIVLPPR